MRGPDRLRLVALEVVVLGAVPGVLLLVELLVPESVEAEFVIRVGRTGFDPVVFITSSVFHGGPEHLGTNVIGYLITVIPIYALCVSIAQRRWFWLTYGSILVLVPVLVGLASPYILPSYVTGGTIRGFSGVVAGLIGFMFVALVAFLGTFLTRKSTAYAALAGIGWVLSGVVLRDPKRSSLPLLGALVLGIGLAVFGIHRDRRRRFQRLDRWTLLFTALLATLLFSAIAIQLRLLFPAAIIGEDSVTNVWAHGTGLLTGVVIAGWGHRYWAHPSTATRRAR